MGLVRNECGRSRKQKARVYSSAKRGVSAFAELQRRSRLAFAFSTNQFVLTNDFEGRDKDVGWIIFGIASAYAWRIRFFVAELFWCSECGLLPKELCSST